MEYLDIYYLVLTGGSVNKNVMSLMYLIMWTQGSMSLLEQDSMSLLEDNTYVYTLQEKLHISFQLIGQDHCFRKCIGVCNEY